VAETHREATLSPPKLEVLSGWIGEQRWYTGRGRRPDLRRIGSWRLDDPAGEVGIETLLVADDAGPEPVVYQVPLTYRGEPLDGADHALVGVAEHSVLGRRWIYDATHDPVYAAQLLDLVQGRVRARSGAGSDTDDARVRGVPDATWRPAARARASRVFAGEQSNTSIVVDADLPDGRRVPLVLKVFRMLSPGENPDVALQEALAGAGSTRVPAALGSVTGQWMHPGPDGAAVASGHLVFAQEYLPGAEDAWRMASRALETGAGFTGPADDLGEATAEVHQALANTLGTTPASPAAVEATLAGMRHRFADAVAVAPDLDRARTAVEAVLERARRANWPALQRIHGDYHLGQALHAPGRGWVLIDFEGEPLRPLADRSTPDHWVRDVAGMLRSIDYVGGTRERSRGRSARSWVAATSAAFLDGYARRRGVALRDAGPLLAAFELDKAMYEVTYEARHRPDWIAIPLAAIGRLTARYSPDSTGTGGPS
jgi:maltokinase